MVPPARRALTSISEWSTPRSVAADSVHATRSSGVATGSGASQVEGDRAVLGEQGDGRLGAGERRRRLERGEEGGLLVGDRLVCTRLARRRHGTERQLVTVHRVAAAVRVA